DEQELVLLGFLVFADPPKPDAAESIARLRRLGIELKVLTGDNERTTAHVCAEVDLPVNGVARGDDLMGLSESEVSALVGTSSNFGNMFSAAGASLFLSFLPMLPSQILLNNLLYDCSELTIPTDRVDEELLARPEHWDVGFIRRFMVFFGPISSLYDFLTFGV